MCVIAALESLQACPDWSTGLSATVKVGYSQDFTTVPVPAVVPALGVITNAALATSVGAFTAPANKGFVMMDIDDTGRDMEIKEVEDSNGAITLSIKFKVRNSKDALGMKKKLKARTKVLLVVDKPHGESIQIGYKGFEAFVKQTEAMEGSKDSHIQFEFECFVGMSVLPVASVFPLQS